MEYRLKASSDLNSKCDGLILDFSGLSKTKVQNFFLNENSIINAKY